MDYFFNSSVMSVTKTGESNLELKLKNREFFSRFNSDPGKPKGCSASLIVTDKTGSIVAIKCNCAKKIFHLVHEGFVLWDTAIVARHKKIILKMLENQKE